MWMKKPKNDLDAAAVIPAVLSSLIRTVQDARELAATYPEIMVSARELFPHNKDELSIIDRGDGQ